MTEKNKTYQSAMNAGHTAAWKQDWEQAASYYQQALNISPGDAAALNSLGLAYFELNNFDRSLACYRDAAEAAPDDPLPWERIARIQNLLGHTGESLKVRQKAADLYYKRKEIEKAIECWTEILILKPDHLLTRSRLATVFEKQGKKNESVAEYLAVASILQQAGEARRAAQVVDYCLQLQAQHPDALNALARLRSNQPLPKPTPPVQPSPAAETPLPGAHLSTLFPPPAPKPIEEAHQKALAHLAGAIFSQAGEAPDETGTDRAKMGSISRDAAPFSASRTRDGKIPYYLARAIDAQTRADDRQTLAELERAVSAGMDHPAAYFLIGLILSQNEQGKAINNLQKSASHPEFTLGAFLLLGQTFFALEKYGESVKAYLQALGTADAQAAPVEKAEEIQRFYETFIEEHTRGGEPEKDKELCQIIETHLNRPDLPSYLASVRRQATGTSGRYYPPLAQILLQTGSGQLFEGISRVQELLERNQPAYALEEAYFLLGQSPAYLPLHMLIAEILYRQGKTQDALSKYILVANLYSLRGEAAQAVRTLEQVLRLEPLNLAVRNQLVALLSAQGNIPGAVEHLIQTAKIQYQLAELVQANEAYSKAIRLVYQHKLRRALLVELLHNKADIDLQMLELRQAAHTYEQIRTIEPGDASARRKLIELQFRLGQEEAALAEADSFLAYLESSANDEATLQFLQQLVEDHPDRLDIRKRLAGYLVKLGNTSAAVEQLDFVADSLLTAGDIQAALAVLKSIIALNPENVSDYQQAYAQLSRKTNL